MRCIYTKPEIKNNHPMDVSLTLPSDRLHFCSSLPWLPAVNKFTRDGPTDELPGPLMGQTLDPFAN